MTEPSTTQGDPRADAPLRADICERLPRLVFGSSALGNLFEAPTDERKLAITAAWIKQGPSPAVIDSAGKYGAGLSLECIGRNLRELDVDPSSVIISNKLGWFRTPLKTPEPTFEPGAWVNLEYDAEQRISRQGILDCWEQGCQLLGEPYRPQLVSVHDPDEFLSAASDEADRQRRMSDLMEAYESLRGLKQVGEVQAIGLGAKDWRVAKEVSEKVDLDWIMIANSLTVYTHPPELLKWIDSLAKRGVAVINSAVFNAGFLVGGRYFDYRIPEADSDEGKQLFAWRDSFFALCEKFDVRPAEACVQFALSPPAVTSVALNTSNPERVADCVALSEKSLPEDFWQAVREADLIDANYPYLGTSG